MAFVLSVERNSTEGRLGEGLRFREIDIDGFFANWVDQNEKSCVGEQGRLPTFTQAGPANIITPQCGRFSESMFDNQSSSLLAPLLHMRMQCTTCMQM